MHGRFKIEIIIGRRSVVYIVMLMKDKLSTEIVSIDVGLDFCCFLEALRPASVPKNILNQTRVE